MCEGRVTKLGQGATVDSSSPTDGDLEAETRDQSFFVGCPRTVYESLLRSKKDGVLDYVKPSFVTQKDMDATLGVLVRLVSFADGSSYHGLVEQGGGTVVMGGHDIEARFVARV
jgi:hypothetical protein